MRRQNAEAPGPGEPDAFRGRLNASRVPGGDTEERRTDGRVPPDYDSCEDEGLVKLYAERRYAEAFNRIVSRYSDIVLGFALKLTRDVHDAEEVRQEVFISLFENMEGFRGNSRFSTWLYRITLNACYMKLRQKRRKTESELLIDSRNIGPDAEASNLISNRSPDELTSYREGMELISEAAGELPESARMVFDMRDIKGLTNSEVGKILGISESAVKSRILRTRIFIRKRITARIREREIR